MLIRCDKACEILADMSARFFHFQEGILVVEGKTDASGWVAELSLFAQLAPRINGCCRTQDMTAFS